MRLRIDTAKKANIAVLLLLFYQLWASVGLGLLIRGTGQTDYSFVMLENHMLLFFLPIAFYFIVTRQDPRAVIPRARLGVKNVLLILAMMITVTPLVMALSLLSLLFAENTMTTLMDDLWRNSNFFISFCAMTVLPPILEELAYRGIVMKGYEKERPFVVALVNGLFFGIMHMNLQQFLYAAFLGFLFCWLVRYTRSIYASILAHFFINAGQMLIAYFSLWMAELAGGGSTEAAEATLASVPLISKIIAFSVIAAFSLGVLAIFAVVFREFRRYNLRRNERADAAAAAASPRPALTPLKKIGFLDPFFFAILAFYVVVIVAERLI